MSSKPPNSSGADYSFPKHLRLKGKKEISELFSDGSFFLFRAIQSLLSHQRAQSDFDKDSYFRTQIKIFQSQINSNRIKRLIREAFRLNKEILFGANHDLNLMIDKIRSGLFR